jgi:hypothetical protein
MKVLFKHLIAGYTGKLDDAVIYYNRYLNKVIIRKNVQPRQGPHHARFKAISQNIFALAPSQGYKDDLIRYADALRKQKAHRYDGCIVWNNTYSRIMFALAKKYPETVDLATLTRAQITSDNLPCQTVRMAVEADMISSVAGWQNLTNPM